MGRLLLLGILTLAVTNLFGARPQLLAEHYDATDLLGATKVYSVCKDRFGFLWFASDNGVAKYDGNKVYRFTQADGLPDNTVFKIYEDKEGRIWPFCHNGNYCFIEKDSVYTPSNSVLLSSLPETTSFLINIEEPGDHNLVLTFASLEWFRVSTNHFLGNALLIRKGKIYEEGIINGRITKATEKGRILKILSNGFVLSDPKGNIIWRVIDPKGAVIATDICIVNDSEIAVCDFFGARMINVTTGKASILLQNIEATGCSTDIDGHLWITTKHKGIYKFHREIKNIKTLPLAPSSRLITLSGRQMFVVSQQHMYELDTSTEEKRPAVITQKLSDHQVVLMCQNEYLALFDPITKVFHLTRNGKTLIHTLKNAKALYRYRDTLVSVEGFMITVWKLGRRKAWELMMHNFTPKRITASCQVRQNATYFIVGDSIMQLSSPFTQTNFVFSHPKIAGATAIIACGNRIAIACKDGSLGSFDMTDKSFKLYEHPRDVINFIPISDTSIIIHSAKGDFIADNNFVATYINYPFSSQLLRNTVVQGSSLITQTSSNVIMFDLSLVNRFSTTQKPYIRKLTVNDSAYNSYDIRLKPVDQIDIQLTLGLLNFNGAPDPLFYRITENKKISAWKELSEHELRVKLTSSGIHIIEICSASGRSALAIRVYAPTPFVKSRSFTFLLLLLTSVIISLTVWQIRRRQLRQQKHELEFMRLQHRSLNALLNPHFIFNAINNIQNLIHKSEKESAAEYLVILSRLIRHNLENLKESLIGLPSELELNHRYITLQNLRFGNRIMLEIYKEFNAPKEILIPPLLIHSFVENAIVHGLSDSTSILKIEIIMRSLDDNYLEIIIRDNGRGIVNESSSRERSGGTPSGIHFNEIRLQRWSELFKVKQSIHMGARQGNDNGVDVVIVLYRHLHP